MTPCNQDINKENPVCAGWPVTIHPMVDLDKELKQAQDEMRSGSLERAAAILNYLQKKLQTSPDSLDLTEEDRLAGLVKVLNNLGVVQKNRGALEDASKSMEQALEIARKFPGKKAKVLTGILSNLGLLYSRRKLYGKALDAFDEALGLAKRHPDQVSTSLLIKLHNNRALFFVRFGEPDNAHEELAQALEAAHGEIIKGNETERQAWLTANLAMVHAELGNEEIYNPSRQEELYRQARTMFIKSATLYGNEGYMHHRVKQLLNAAEINLRLRAHEEAKRLIIEARKEAERLGDGRLLCEVAQVSVEHSLQACDQEQVIERVKEAIGILTEIKPADLTTRWVQLEGCLRRAGKDEALKLLSEYSSEKNSNGDSRNKTGLIDPL